VQKPGPQLSEHELDDPEQMPPFHEVEDLKLQASSSGHLELNPEKHINKAKIKMQQLNQAYLCEKSATK